jgi:hypothetical protein
MMTYMPLNGLHLMTVNSLFVSECKNHQNSLKVLVRAVNSSLVVLKP